MIHYRIIQNSIGQKVLELNLHGKSLLSIPQFNKGTAFTQEERESFGLLGKLPYCEENIEQQAKRALEQFHRFQEPLNKNSYLNELLNQNQTLFYYLLENHLEEMLPIVYTPVVAWLSLVFINDHFAHAVCISVILIKIALMKF
jgi:malate dehydrogenase (oxaloacetate-decarboxylating)